MHSTEPPDKGATHVPGRTGLGGARLRPVAQNDVQVTTQELRISGIFHVTFLDCRATETVESRTANEGGRLQLDSDYTTAPKPNRKLAAPQADDGCLSGRSWDPRKLPRPGAHGGHGEAPGRTGEQAESAGWHVPSQACVRSEPVLR